MSRRTLKPGDRVIFTRTKRSEHPGPRAREISPAPHGDEYTYCVDKFWVVADEPRDGKVLLRTRRGKEHLVDCDHRNLRLATWWEKLVYAGRFPRHESEPVAS